MSSNTFPRTIKIIPDQNVLKRITNKKKSLVNLIVVIVCLLHLIDYSRNESLTSGYLTGYGICFFGMIIMINRIIGMLITSSDITFTLADKKLLLNNRYLLDYSGSTDLTCVEKSENGRFWYFISRNKKVHTEYFEPYKDLVEKLSEWLKNDNTADDECSNQIRKTTIRQIVIESVRDLFAGSEVLAGIVSHNDELKKKCCTVRRMNAVWNIFWVILLPVSTEIVFGITFFRMHLPVIQYLAILVLFMLMFSFFQLAFLFISNIFLKPYQSFCNRIMNDKRKNKDR